MEQSETTPQLAEVRGTGAADRGVSKVAHVTFLRGSTVVGHGPHSRATEQGLQAAGGAALVPQRQRITPSEQGIAHQLVQARGTSPADRGVARKVAHVTFLRGSTVIGHAPRFRAPIQTLQSAGDPALASQPQRIMESEQGISQAERIRERAYLDDPDFDFESRLRMIKRHSNRAQQEIIGQPASPQVRENWDKIEDRRENWWLMETLTESAIVGAVLTLVGSGAGPGVVTALKWLGRGLTAYNVGRIAGRLSDPKPLSDREKAALIVTIIPMIVGTVTNRLVSGLGGSPLKRFADGFRAGPRSAPKQPRPTTSRVIAPVPQIDADATGRILKLAEQNAASGAFRVQTSPNGRRLTTVIPDPTSRASRDLIVTVEEDGNVSWESRSESSARAASANARKISMSPVRVDPATRLPTQMWRRDEFKIGPAYSSFDQARASRAKETSHITENVLTDSSGKTVAKWWEVSESMREKGIRGLGRISDTEQKALLRVRLEPGMTLEIRGTHPPCTVSSGCDIAMQAVAKSTGARIVYRMLTGGIVEYPREH